jgi:uncharacterized membrane protein YidH (DUF202 family)
MSMFIKVLITGLVCLFLGGWWLYGSLKKPSKTKEPYNFNSINFIRAIALLVLSLILFISLFV